MLVAATLQPSIPGAPTVVADDAANTLAFSGAGTIEFSENNGAWVDYAGIINVGNVARAAGYWRARVKANGAIPAGNIASSPAFTYTAPTGVTKADINVYVTNAFYADQANIVGGGALVDGAVIDSFPDALTNKVIPYAGQATPSRGRPQWFDGGVTFYNEKEVFFYGYDSGQGWPVNNNPQEMTIVLRIRPGQDWEAISGDIYIGFGGGQIRVADQYGYIAGTTLPPMLSVAVLHVSVTESGGSTITKLWVNGVYKGQYSMTGSKKRGAYQINAYTNATDHDFIAKFYKDGLMSDADRTAYLTKLNTYFNTGAMPTNPYASNVTCSKSGNSYTAGYTYNGVNPENVGAVEYEWYELDTSSGGFVQAKLASTAKTISYSGGKLIKPEIRVKDNQGNSWRFIGYPGWV